MKVVIARYNEDLSWISKIKYETIVFNKNENEKHLFENNLPNVGREGHTFFNFIVNNYKNLPDFIAFLQGNPYDHCPNFIEIINNFDFKKDFTPIGPLFEETTKYESINKEVTSFSKKIGFDLKFPLFCVRGAQYIISKNLIQKKPIEYYKKILDTVSHEIYPQAGLDIEKTLFQIYGIYKP